MKNKFGIEKSQIKKGCLVNTVSSIGFGKCLGKSRNGFKIKFSNGFEIATFEQIRAVKEPESFEPEKLKSAKASNSKKENSFPRF